MIDFILAKQNGRAISGIDRIFGINAKANEAKARGEDVVNATVGALLDEDGRLAILSSVHSAAQAIQKEDQFKYAPIGGIERYKEAVKNIALGSEIDAYVEAVSTPGGTGGIRNTISNYSAISDTVLTSDWHWAPYNTIAGEIYRKVDTFELFNKEGGFNIDSFLKKAKRLIIKQGSLVIILNTPSHNPTGYSIKMDEWKQIVAGLNEISKIAESIALLVDIAYIDFSSFKEKSRDFIPLLLELNKNVLPIIAFSASKTFTGYGMRTGAALCLAKDMRIAQEFRQVNEYSSRGSWSNSPALGQMIISKIYEDKDLMKAVSDERDEYVDMLLKRGEVFTEAMKNEGLEMIPFDSGFFASIPCEDSMRHVEDIMRGNVFLVPLPKGIRISLASISIEQASKLPAIIAKTLKKQYV